MKPIDFPGTNIVLGKNQPQYQALPAIRLDEPEGSVISCWEISEEELKSIIENKKIYIKQLTFGHSFQPLLPMVDLGEDISFI